MKRVNFKVGLLELVSRVVRVGRVLNSLYFGLFLQQGLGETHVWTILILALREFLLRSKLASLFLLKEQVSCNQPPRENE
ncbi:hypothetical protein HanXRQr2_Chr15g0708771 [Helianthus annuus]|uniref:Uncharacterized protein n=1 Tax=Helianthus annuus TaxID=4232 RepID=A0A251SBB2_HELAN|nr:hypothetical protein HanXRQr2_Chr15g0708771 [Helianthus annuus]KAJ0832572.1 hypothetical protein HanPSC8_Chr15g0680261 [Helianthus annuus]